MWRIVAAPAAKRELVAAKRAGVRARLPGRRARRGRRSPPAAGRRRSPSRARARRDRGRSLGAPQRARAAEPGLDLVGDRAARPRAGWPRRGRARERRRRGMHAALALDGLDEDRRRRQDAAVRVVSAQRSARAQSSRPALAARAERAAIGGRKGQVVHVGGARRRAAPCGACAPDSSSAALRHPVVGAAERDHAAAPGRRARELDRGLDRVGPGRPAEQDPSSAQRRRQDPEQRLDERVAQRRRRDPASSAGRRSVDRRVQRRDDGRVAMPERERARAGKAVQIRRARRIAHMDAVTVGELDRQPPRVRSRGGFAPVPARELEAAGRHGSGRRHRPDARRQAHLTSMCRVVQCHGKPNMRTPGCATNSRRLSGGRAEEPRQRRSGGGAAHDQPARGLLCDSARARPRPRDATFMWPAAGCTSSTESFTPGTKPSP